MTEGPRLGHPLEEGLEGERVAGAERARPERIYEGALLFVTGIP
jgi:hypothetical protein